MPDRLDPDALYNQLVDLGETWADQDAAASALEEALRGVKALAFLSSDGKNVAEREAKMNSDPSVTEHIGYMVEARRVANRSRVRYDVGKVRVELIRTLESTRRAEMALR